MTWSPHPLARPAPYVVGTLQSLLALALLADHAFDGAIHALGGWGHVIGGIVVALAAATTAFAVPRATRHAVLWSSVLVGALVTALPFLPDMLPLLREPPLVAGLALVAIAGTTFSVSEHHRRAVRLTLDKENLHVHVRRYRIEHTLPLEAVRNVRAARSTRGKLLGYGDFQATTKKGTMEGNVSRPLVGEDAPDDATRGNGWDTEGQFHLLDAHPYKRVQRALENRIALARLSPRERQEQELAYRLQEDLGRLEV